MQYPVDMLAYAFDRSPDETILVLITAEPSFSYALSFLRLRQYRVVLIAPETEDTLRLLSQASLSFNWSQEDNEASGAEAQPISHKASGSSESRYPRRPNSTVPSTGRSTSSSSNGTYAEKPSLVDKTPDVNLEDYLPQRQASDSIQPSELALPPNPNSGHEDAFHRNPTAFLPESLPQDSTGLQQSQGSNPHPGRLGGTTEMEEDNNNCPTPTRPQWFNPLPQAPPTSPEYSQEIPTPSHSGLSPQSTYYTYQLVNQPEPHPSAYCPTSPGSQSNTASQRMDYQHAYKTYPDAYGWYGSQPNGSVVSDTEDNIALYPGSSNTTTGPEQETSAAPDHPAIEAGFSILLDVLRHLKANGYPRPLRSYVGMQITARDKKAYQRVGTTKFAQYTAKAEKLGLITMGGQMANAWIALNEP